MGVKAWFFMAKDKISAKDEYLITNLSVDRNHERQVANKINF